MLTIFNETGKKMCMLGGNAEALLRMICDEPKNAKLFSKETDDDAGKITFKSLGNTEAKVNIGVFYLWKDYVLKFEVS